MAQGLGHAREGLEDDALRGEQLAEWRLRLNRWLERVVLAGRPGILHELLLDDDVAGTHGHFAAIDDAIALPGLHSRWALLRGGGVAEGCEAVADDLIRVAHRAVSDEPVQLELL